ncbi:hypothetical protein A3E39_04175 [Candidatus Uhrbacteria bacterium RIFCSPHIGHO2_12_FULL_60_25]|uniref:Uncharacterized protein n=1 Tax=Candidatus Uhrbacteria bacterium RIFCSPHIGHO2_12_FULL_60_25 TaxID=1802399 RepID=A0A1F7ULJ1_9BACT|nr:MAG: hypothetical protein A3D73_01200 [Candidatus Uhrbacteria bacterium RIFCSPHIGHO2_02_FULL_60_44]OGL79131.1 MAG: hypothetical protein A3E39_04175 [Candidatus Uhrbacteria bacterium RIFCSPHIGHO2_12_FULL_60_25]
MLANIYHRHFHASTENRNAYIARDRLCVEGKVHLIRQMLFDTEYKLMVLKECTFLDHAGRTLDIHDSLSGLVHSKHFPHGILASCDGSCAPIQLPIPSAAVHTLAERNFAPRSAGVVFETSRWDGVPRVELCVGGFAHVTLAHEWSGNEWRNARPCDGDCAAKRVRLEGTLVKQISAFLRGTPYKRSRTRAAAHPDL